MMEERIQDLDALSNNARVMLCTSFTGDGSTLHLGLVQSIPSPECKAAIKGLVAAGILHRRQEPGGGFTLSLTDEGKLLDRRPPGETSSDKWQFIHDNNFTLNIPNPDDMTAPGAALRAAGVTAEQAQAAQDARFDRKGRKKDMRPHSDDDFR